MAESSDIRDRAHLSGEEAAELNFIKSQGLYVFRKYYRFGLRSHIFEVLLKTDVEKETTGELRNGIRTFPRAIPKKMFRILRSRFDTINMVFDEIEKYNILLNSLGPDLIACSEEFIVDYTDTGNSQMVLCGLQEYVDGEILDPWRVFDHDYLLQVYKPLSPDAGTLEKRVTTAYKNIEQFVKKIRNMIMTKGFIPDLAGIGNLILTPEGNLKLVDINNIVEIKIDDEILIDDKGYPSCDVSVEVLSILERKILNKKLSMDDPLYHFFLSPPRRRQVKALEKKFYKSL